MLYDSKKWDKLPVNTFKSAKELGLTEEQHDTLIKTLALFEEGKVPPEMFNMNRVGHPECGTPGCILGWSKTISMSVYDRTEGRRGWFPHELDRLFFPSITSAYEIGAYMATPKQAATALRGYLETAHTDWPAAMKEGA